MSGFFVRMRGPSCAISFRVTAPSGVDLTTAVKSLTVDFVVHGSASRVDTWAFSAVLPGSMTATFVPNGTEFTRHGPLRIDSYLTADAVEYPFVSLADTVRETP